MGDCGVSVAELAAGRRQLVEERNAPLRVLFLVQGPGEGRGPVLQVGAALGAQGGVVVGLGRRCLLYTSDAADEL